ncbi:hypothetical protein [Longimicrobium terrae]|uniref:CHRD domain-containing protein n=1 Tax=Longimicrobium terrae TaxID=1639882 RepID=A0A841GUL9_9BACT|nr:hypothetical protein [Longimicrobium terrae]MBB4634296.1 hypothetical protein [Longimicrobium terrae]MBB6068814.1 hypothetical protein [Longimicrobium terrae]NNC27998.1 hypothetical protein [Longimicrobium terrae]
MNARFWMVSALPLAFAACGGGDAAEGGAADSTATVSAAPAPEMNPAPAPAMDSGAAAPAAGMVAMNAVGASGVTGQVQVMDHGANESMVAVTLTAPGTTTHSGHIHEGTCDAPGKVVVPLQDVTLANGTGTSSTTIPVPLATVMNGKHIVAYHEKSGTEPGSPVVCGAIPAQSATAAM